MFPEMPVDYTHNDALTHQRGLNEGYIKRMSDLDDSFRCWEPAVGYVCREGGLGGWVGEGGGYPSQAGIS